MFNAPIEGLEIESYAQPDILAMYPQYTQNQNCAIAVCKRKQLTFLNARVVGLSFLPPFPTPKPRKMGVSQPLYVSKQRTGGYTEDVT